MPLMYIAAGRLMPSPCRAVALWTGSTAYLGMRKIMPVTHHMTINISQK